jgi:hypothetical protein
MSVTRRRKDREQVAESPATVPTATGDARAPTRDEIARRAFQLFEERGSEPGREWEDWFRAERELRDESNQHEEG